AIDGSAWEQLHLPGYKDALFKTLGGMVVESREKSEEAKEYIRWDVRRTQKRTENGALHVSGELDQDYHDTRKKIANGEELLDHIEEELASLLGKDTPSQRQGRG